MRDIERRIRRYRLGRYGADGIPVLRRLRWIWLVALAWVAWAGLLSDHSFFRLWRMERENARMRAEHGQVREDIRQLDLESTDSRLASERTERLIRERGMARPGELVYRIRSAPADSQSGRTDRR